MGAVLRGFDAEIARLWEGLQALTPHAAGETADVALVVTADHGHITVPRENMVPLPAELEAALQRVLQVVRRPAARGLDLCERLRLSVVGEAAAPREALS